MAFEKVSKRDSYLGSNLTGLDDGPHVTVGLKGKLWLNKTICETQYAKGYRWIRLLFDRETDTIALDFTRHGDKTNDWVFNPKPMGYHVSCRPFILKFDIDRKVQALGIKRFKAEIQHNLVTVQLKK